MGQSVGGKVGVQSEPWSQERADPRLEWNSRRQGEGGSVALPGKGEAAWVRA